MRLASPLDPFVKGSYRFMKGSSEQKMFSFREMLFWQNTEKFGVTSRVVIEKMFRNSWMQRWTGSATFTQETEGVQWFSQLTLFQNLHEGRAISYQIGIAAESDLEVPVTDYGLRVIYRRSIFNREWLFLELRSSITWPREDLVEHRVSNLGAGVALEMMFGERRH